MSFIQVRDLEHGYSAGGLFSKRHRVQVLSGLNLDLHEGQSLGLLGGSGSGKSTLARLLMGLESADQGSIVFKGQPPFLQRVQMVFQDALSAFNPPAQHWLETAESLRHSFRTCGRRRAGPGLSNCSSKYSLRPVTSTSFRHN